ncbi:MAG: leucine-rich repeat domain-containing protein [Ruminococcaceae bacterium]|nr:leucine-rich repeat domain-containing protein [Oscillospiraceae bacterium]
MKKKILLITSIVAVLACLFAISVSAENKIIKLDTLPTLEEIHADREAYVSHLDAFDGNSYGEKDSESVVVLSDLAETPTYYVFPAYYYVQSTHNDVYDQLPKLNSAIAAADPSAFAGYAANSSSWGRGSCKQLIRFEVPTYVANLTAKAKFEGSSNLVEVYFPTHTVTDEATGLEKEVTYITSISGQNLFSSCSKLQYIHNMGLLPVDIVQGNLSGFADCSSLREVAIPEGTTSIPNFCFTNCAALTEVVMPNSVTAVGKQAFCNCSSLETVRFSANFTSYIRVNRDYETFMGSNKLKYVYLPATIASSLAATANEYQNIFNSSSAKTVYFITADYDTTVGIQEIFKATNANKNIGNANIEAFDPSKDYTNYADSITKSVIVYGYSACEAFYDGNHETSDNYTIEYSGKEWLSAATKYKACANCIAKADVKELAPLFVSLGYSTNGKGGIVQGFSFNNKDRAEYEAVLGTISYGVVAAVDNREDKTQGADVFALEKYISCDLSNAKYDFFDIKITGVTEDKADIALFFCAYTEINGNRYFIHNGEIAETVTSVLFN